MKNGNLGEFALGIAGKMDGNAFFPKPKVTPEQLTAKANEFIGALASCVDGTSADTAHQKSVRTQLTSLLDVLANDIEDTAKGNLEMLASTGFNLTSPGGGRLAPVGTVSFNGVSNPASGKLAVDLNVQGNVWAVVLQRMTVPGVWVMIAVFTDLNNTVLSDLVPGTIYTLRACAMAAGNQQSEWCGPISHMST